MGIDHLKIRSCAARVCVVTTILIVALFCVGCDGEHRPIPQPVITGTVLDSESGTALVGAKVWIMRDSISGPEVQSDADGAYVIHPILMTDTLLIGEKEGYQPDTLVVPLREGKYDYRADFFLTSE